MIPVTLITPAWQWIISLSISSLPLIRALANASGDHTNTGQIITPKEQFENVPVSAIYYLDLCHKAGALV